LEKALGGNVLLNSLPAAAGYARLEALKTIGWWL